MFLTLLNSHFTSVLKSLHWLKIEQCIHYKVLFNTYEIFNLENLRTYITILLSNRTASLFQLTSSLFNVVQFVLVSNYIFEIIIYLSITMYFSMELRELNVMLKAAYTNKERLAQISEKNAEKLDEKARDLEAVRVMAEKREREEEEERRREIAHYHEMKQYSQDLKRQMHVSVTHANLLLLLIITYSNNHLITRTMVYTFNYQEFRHFYVLFILVCNIL